MGYFWRALNGKQKMLQQIKGYIVWVWMRWILLLSSQIINFWMAIVAICRASQSVLDLCTAGSIHCTQFTTNESLDAGQKSN